MWKPVTVQEATIAMDLSIALRDLAGRHLLPAETYAIIDDMQKRDEPSPALRLHAAILTFFKLDPLSNTERVSAIVSDYHALLTAEFDNAIRRRTVLSTMIAESERIGMYDTPELSLSEGTR